MGYQELIQADPGLLWYWRFDGSSLIDSKNSISVSGENDTSSFFGTLFPAVGNGSINVNGSTGTDGLYANVNGSAAFGQTDFSVEFFYKRNSISPIKGSEILLDARTTAASGWVIFATSSQIYFQIGAASVADYTTFPLDLNVHHVVVTRSYNKSPIIYLDGIARVSGSVESNNINNSSYLSIGNRAFSQFPLVASNATFDEVSIYNYAMSGTIVGQHYSTARYYGDAHNIPWIGMNNKMRK